ncbi:hypothetical protein, partial [Brachybacterium sp.]|uniref:hypothetical protein n=1 Tax=Brachybacterium sp. TaxID=1891286 RepID=UPI002ED2EC8C
MSRQRKYLDRGRRIALEGRADAAPFLSEAMGEGVSSLPPSPRPALLDHPFLRSALDRREHETMGYLTEQWSAAWVDPLPRDAAEVRGFLDRPDCITTGSGAHLMTGY